MLEKALQVHDLHTRIARVVKTYPITLKFAGKVGDILTTLPPEGKDGEDDRQEEYKPLPFWHYI